MVSTPSPWAALLTPAALGSLLGVVLVFVVSLLGAKILLSRYATAMDRFTFIWLAFDGLIHTIFEGSFLWYSLPTSTVHRSTEPLSYLWKEYALADSRWGVGEATVVSLELLTVFIGAPLCFYIIYQIIRGDEARHYWIIVLCTGELYGGWMTFCPEWLTGSPSLDTSNPLYLWIYLIFMNVIWVFIPLVLMVDSYRHIASALRGEALVRRPSKMVTRSKDMADKIL